jgi:hypothetical protein
VFGYGHVQIADGLHEGGEFRLLLRELDDLIRRRPAVEPRLHLGGAPQDQVKLVGGKFQGMAIVIRMSRRFL